MFSFRKIRLAILAVHHILNNIIFTFYTLKRSLFIIAIQSYQLFKRAVAFRMLQKEQSLTNVIKLTIWAFISEYLAVYSPTDVAS